MSEPKQACEICGKPATGIVKLSRGRVTEDGYHKESEPWDSPRCDDHGLEAMMRGAFGT